MKKLLKITNALSNASSLISGFVLLAATLLVVVNVIGRRFFNAPVFGASELICYLALAAAGFSLVCTEWMDGNVKMTFFFEKASQKTIAIVDLIGNIVCAPIIGYISYLLLNQVFTKLAKNDVSVELKFPMYIVSAALALGFILLTLVLVAKVVVRANDVIKGGYYNFKLAALDEAAEAMEMAKESHHEEA